MKFNFLTLKCKNSHIAECIEMVLKYLKERDMEDYTVMDELARKVMKFKTVIDTEVFIDFLEYFVKHVEPLAYDVDEITNTVEANEIAFYRLGEYESYDVLEGIDFSISDIDEIIRNFKIFCQREIAPKLK